MKCLVTGGCGFIGSEFIRQGLRDIPDIKIVNLDLLTYAGNPENLHEVESDPRYSFVKGDIADPALMNDLIDGTYAEIAQANKPVVTTTQEAVDRLKMGNSRFFSGKSDFDRVTANIRRAQIMTQSPFAVVLGCSDSRVPIELVFDQSLGDVFSIRVAGNIVDPATLGSIEYAVKHLNAKVIVVMGHEGCGAVSAAVLPAQEQQKEPEHVQYLLNAITPSVTNLAKIRDKKARMREAAIANVRWQVARLKENSVVAAAVANGQLGVVGGFYEISSGAVDFLETEEELAVESPTAEAANGD